MNKSINLINIPFVSITILFLFLFIGNNFVVAAPNYSKDPFDAIICCNAYINEKGCTLGNARCIDPKQFSGSSCAWFPNPDPTAKLNGRTVV